MLCKSYGYIALTNDNEKNAVFIVCDLHQEH